MSARTRPLVFLGMLGPTLDDGHGPRRWSRWRPSVGLCQDPALVISRFELLFDPKFTALAKVVTDDIKQISPKTEVRPQHVTMRGGPAVVREVTPRAPLDQRRRSPAKVSRALRAQLRADQLLK